MEFAPFTCLFVFDSSSSDNGEGRNILELRAATRQRVAGSELQHYSVTHFDSELTQEQFLSTNCVELDPAS